MLTMDCEPFAAPSLCLNCCPCHGATFDAVSDGSQERHHGLIDPVVGQKDGETMLLSVTELPFDILSNYDSRDDQSTWSELHNI